MKINNQKGVTIVETVLLLVIIGIIGFSGYKVYQTRHDLDQQSASQTTTASANQEGAINPDSVPTVNSSSDLNKAEQSLNAVNTDDDNSDLSQLSTQSSSF